ncbi:Transcriptional regulator [Paraburkholderia ribeironis]|uniref:Transcriptional regulator n=1 Tax=Paraburkholderia ribeironis TaxID=1247936 RepID=A0A1N7RKH5_9BURK|nr:LysR family transcriptional regulator [Paraburkholderia ribeironis]SIT35585.1 Transcriptional regulator [Paraburkholderia ribeironis]
MDMMQSIRAFDAVATSGSFTGAARNMNVGTPQVSRAIADLEAHLGLRLLNRTTRSVELTVAGEQYLVHCKSILASLEKAEAEAAGMCAIPSGTLRVGIDPAVDRLHLGAIVSAYQDRYPKLSVEIALATGGREPESASHDVLLVCGSPPEGEKFASVSLGSVGFVLCASPVYLGRYGIPQVIGDLCRHRWLQLASADRTSGQWQFNGPDGSEVFSPAVSAIRTDLIDVLTNAVTEGAGIAPIPIASAMPGLRSGTLVRVLPRYRSTAQNVHALYPAVRYRESKVETWIEFLAALLPQRFADDHRAFASYVENSTPKIECSPGNGTTYRVVA